MIDLSRNTPDFSLMRSELKWRNNGSFRTSKLTKTSNALSQLWCLLKEFFEIKYYGFRARRRCINLIRELGSIPVKPPRRNLYTRTLSSRSLASRVVYLRSVRRALSTTAAGMMKELGTSLRNRRTVPSRPLISIVYARRLFKHELNISS